MTVSPGEPTRRTENQRRTRQQIAAAALSLFAEHGYADTTVDQIAAAAGVARRTFFRYFPGKDDAIFPDHDETLARVAALLAEAGPDEAPLTVVYRGIREVLRMYAADPKVSVARYRLLREVPALREREIAVVSRYERLFTRYLLDHPSNQVRGADDTDAPLLAEVSAAAVVAAHNHVLRRWLRAGGEGDVEAHLDHAVATIRTSFLNGHSTADDGGEVVVAVLRTNLPPERIAEKLRNSLE